MSSPQSIYRMTNRRSGAFVDQNGVLSSPYSNSRTATSSIKKVYSAISWWRFGLVVSILGFAAWTNEANHTTPRQTVRSIVNYGLFTLSSSTSSSNINIQFGGKWWDVCQRNRIFHRSNNNYNNNWFEDYFSLLAEPTTVEHALEKSICQDLRSLTTINKNSKPLLWDPTDRPYTMNRIICSLLWASMLINWILCGGMYSIFQQSPAVLRSLFYLCFVDHDINTMIGASTILFPALKSLDQLIRSYATQYEYEDWHFLAESLILSLGIGAFSNHCASRFWKTPVCGFDTSLAAAVGYQISLSKMLDSTPTTIFSFVLTGDHGATQYSLSFQFLFWLQVTSLFLGRRYPKMSSILLAGMLGHAFGEFQLKIFVPASWLDQADILARKFWKQTTEAVTQELRARGMMGEMK